MKTTTLERANRDWMQHLSTGNTNFCPTVSGIPDCRTPPSPSWTPLQERLDDHFYTAAVPWALCKAKSSPTAGSVSGEQENPPSSTQERALLHLATKPDVDTDRRNRKVEMTTEELGQLAQPVGYFYDKAHLRNELSHPDAATTGTQRDRQ